MTTLFAAAHEGFCHIVSIRGSAAIQTSSLPP